MSKSFSDFMQKYYNIFIAYCKSRGLTDYDSDEIVSEAFIRLWQKWNDRYQEDYHRNKKWMYNTIEYIILEHNRDKAKHQVEDIDSWSENLTDNATVDENLHYTELIREIILKLNDSEDELFKLAYLHQLPYTEICRQLGINDQALRTRISRLKHKLIKIITELKNNS